MLERNTWFQYSLKFLARINMLNLFGVALFRATIEWAGNKAPLPEISQTFTTIVSLGAVIPYLKRIQGIYGSRNTSLGFCWHQHFVPRISIFCYIKKYRYYNSFNSNRVFNPFQTVGVLVGCVKSREFGARAPPLPSFILLVSFSDTLLAVSILDIVYDCDLWQLLQSWKGY